MSNFDPRPLAVETIRNLRSRGLTYAEAGSVIDWVRGYLNGMTQRELEHLPLAEGVAHPFDIDTVRPSSLNPRANGGAAGATR